MALGAGAAAGLGAVAFRYLILSLTWLATGYPSFGQNGREPSAHLPAVGPWFCLFIPIVGGLLYGPIIHRLAPEARGSGVSQVMLAVAKNGGRIRTRVGLVKTLASATCIGAGGSVGREGPVVHIGSALAVSLGQWARIPEDRMRILAVCGAAGGISATFNAPVAGTLFGIELILREVAVDSMASVMVSAMVANVIGQAFFGSAPFLGQLPAGIALPHTYDYLLVGLLGITAALIGLAYIATFFGIDQLCDSVWAHRPEWARPAVGGVLLGLLLLAVPQLYGVGYPVLFKAVAGAYSVGFLLLLAAGKMVGSGLTIGIGGSGGVFAPSVFIGATSGMAFGEISNHLFGPSAGQPALYAVVGMGAVFASASWAPLTALASMLELTQDFALTLPLVAAITLATTISKALGHGTIYTTKLLRQGIDLDTSGSDRARTAAH